MRILLISQSIVSGDGQGRVNLELARHCLSRGHPVTVLADRVEPQLISAGAAWVPFHPALQRPDLAREISFAAGANRIVRRMRNNFDLIVGNGYTLTETHHVNLSQFVHGAHHVREGAFPHRLGLRAAYHSLYTRFNARQEKRAYAAASLVIACSRRVREELIGIGVPDGRIRVVYGGVDTQEFCPGPADRAAIGIPAGVPFALFVGDIRTPRKNLDTVLRAMALVPQVRLAVVGAVGGSPYPAMARRLGLEGRVTFLGYRCDVPAIMRACDYLVFPTRYEPFGLVALESLSTGLPVVVTRRAGVAEIMNSSCGIILEEPDNVAMLAKAMKNLCDPHARDSAAKAAREVSGHYGWQQMAENYIDIFQEAAAACRVPQTAPALEMPLQPQ